MSHDTILCCKDIDISHMMIILNHKRYKVNAYSSKDNGAGKEVKVKSKNLASTLTASGTN